MRGGKWSSLMPSLSDRRQMSALPSVGSAAGVTPALDSPDTQSSAGTPRKSSHWSKGHECGAR